MACHNNSDLEILPKLAEHSKKLMKLEEYLSFVIESTQYWHESKYMVKNEIREIFAALSSMLHQREMQLYRQVDELHINLGSPTLNVSHESHLQQGKNSLQSSNMPRKFFSNPYASPPLKLKFLADVGSLEEAINSFGCLEMLDGSISEDDNFIIINPEDAHNVEDENLSDDVLRDGLGRNSNGDHTEASSAGSSVSSASFDVLDNLPDNEATVPWSKRNSNLDHLPLCTSNSEQNDVQNQAISTSVTPSVSCDSVGILAENKAPGSWLRNDTNKHPSSCGGLPSRVRSTGGSSSILSHHSASNGIAQWLRKSNETKSSSAAILTMKDIASSLPFTDTFKAKGSPAFTEDFGKLGNHFRSTGVPENNEIIPDAVGSCATSIVKNGNPHLAVNVPNSNPVPDFSSMISKMLGNGNNGWLGRNHSNVVPPLSGSGVVTDTMKHKSILCSDRTSLLTEALSTHVNNAEKSNSPASCINKMFSPYFKSNDKNNWLVKNHTNNKTCIYS